MARASGDDQRRSMRRFFRSKGTLALFVSLYMVGLGGLALARGNTEFVFYGVVMLVLIGLVAWTHTRVGFSWLVLWGLAIWGLLHMAGGNIPVGTDSEGEDVVLYSFRAAPFVPRYDQIVHALGFFVATLASWEALRAAVRPLGRLRATPGVAVGVGLMGMGWGALNEVVEFVAVITLPSTNVGGYVNTGWDLVSNLVGATSAALLVYLRDR